MIGNRISLIWFRSGLIWSVACGEQWCGWVGGWVVRGGSRAGGGGLYRHKHRHPPKHTKPDQHWPKPNNKTPLWGFKN